MSSLPLPVFVARIGLLALAAAFSAAAGCAQTVEPAQASFAADDHLPAMTERVDAPSYAFPDRRQQFRNYLDSTFGPAAFVRAAVGASLDQGKPAPPEWDSGAQGFGERYGFRLGMGMITETAKYSGGAAMHLDVAYHKCECGGVFPRAAHAMVSPFTARTRTGRTVLSLPSIAAPYAGSFAAVNAWYPSRYGPEEAARLGTFSFTLGLGANLVREFLLPAR